MGPSEALLHELRLAISLGIKRILVYGDSAVVINQVNKSWDRNKENMDAYCLEVRKLENKFYGLEFHHVVCDNNVATDVLSKLGSTRAQVPAGVFVHELHASSIPEPVHTTTDTTPSQPGKEVMMIDVDWRQPFIDYICEQKVPSANPSLGRRRCCPSTHVGSLRLMPLVVLLVIADERGRRQREVTWAMGAGERREAVLSSKGGTWAATT
jgi:hypothetical protein